MSDKQSKRQRRILEIVTLEGRVEVTRLADIIGVSRVTIRTDADLLAGRGLVRQDSTDDINNRLNYHHDKKQRMA
ncbi:MAG: HTH domain-containing protein [Treponema sp.]|jgi:DeoR/GlpR family transcriptional regulator of sugar metabolism|nr:HTH domain-containing protein [Treponema sp.]